MKWTPVKFRMRINGSYSIIKKIPRKKGSQFLNNFLEKFVIDFIKINFKHYQYTQDLTFEYEEKQLHSSILPAIHKITDACIREYPIKRGVKTRKRNNSKGKTRSTGYIDYWAIYDDNPLLIEVKHKIMSIQMGASSSLNGITSKWSNMIDQLNSIEKKQIRQVSRSKPNVYKLGMYFLPLKYESNNRPQSITKGVELYAQKVFNHLAPIPDWMALVKFNDFISYNHDKKIKYKYPVIILSCYEDIVRK